jgi:hypothetical protein
MKPELVQDAIKSGKNLVIIHEPGTGLYANINSVIQKPVFFISNVDSINSLLSVLNNEKYGNAPLIIDIESCDFMLVSVLKSIFQYGEFHYKTATKDLKYTVRNRIILTTTNQYVFNSIKIGAEEHDGLVVNWVCTPEEKLQRLREIFLTSLVSDVTLSKAEEIFDFCYSKVGHKLNLRHLVTVISFYKSSGFYKTAGSKYLKTIK